jgi:hypothetical protein
VVSDSKAADQSLSSSSSSFQSTWRSTRSGRLARLRPQR